MFLFSSDVSFLLQIKMDPEMDSQLKIGFIGAGNMAFGIAKGILSGESGDSSEPQSQFKRRGYSLIA